MTVTGKGIAVALAVAVALIFLALGTPILSSFGGLNPAADEMAVGTTTSFSTSTTPMELAQNPGEPLPTDLVITDTVIGSGAEATAGSMVAVHYTGALPDGTVFDTSAKSGEPIVFQLGAGRVISGWEEGIAGMKVGGKRRLVIPPSMGYGPQGYPPVIPGNATLFFDVELVAVQ